MLSFPKFGTASGILSNDFKGLSLTKKVSHGKLPIFVIFQLHIYLRNMYLLHRTPKSHFMQCVDEYRSNLWQPWMEQAA